MWGLEEDNPVFVPTKFVGETKEEIDRKFSEHFAAFVKSWKFPFLVDARDGKCCFVCGRANAPEASLLVLGEEEHGGQFVSFGESACSMPAGFKHTLHRACFWKGVFDECLKRGGMSWSSTEVILMDSFVDKQKLGKWFDEGLVGKASALRGGGQCPACSYIGYSEELVQQAMRHGWRAKGRDSALTVLSVAYLGSDALVRNSPFASRALFEQRYRHEHARTLLEHAVPFTFCDFEGYRALEFCFVEEAEQAKYYAQRKKILHDWEDEVEEGNVRAFEDGVLLLEVDGKRFTSFTQDGNLAGYAEVPSRFLQKKGLAWIAQSCYFGAILMPGSDGSEQLMHPVGDEGMLCNGMETHIPEEVSHSVPSAILVPLIQGIALCNDDPSKRSLPDIAFAVSETKEDIQEGKLLLSPEFVHLLEKQRENRAVAPLIEHCVSFLESALLGLEERVFVTKAPYAIPGSEGVRTNVGKAIWTVSAPTRVCAKVLTEELCFKQLGFSAIAAAVRLVPKEQRSFAVAIPLIGSQVACCTHLIVTNKRTLIMHDYVLSEAKRKELEEQDQLLLSLFLQAEKELLENPETRASLENTEPLAWRAAMHGFSKHFMALLKERKVTRQIFDRKDFFCECCDAEISKPLFYSYAYTIRTQQQLNPGFWV